ncbi:MAG: hypothetical protein HOP28_15415 [Gemmatimonadales bacterium]|nr:hypothetical protein [Gemmatimonadales bacterium]
MTMLLFVAVAAVILFGGFALLAGRTEAPGTSRRPSHDADTAGFADAGSKGAESEGYDSGSADGGNDSGDAGGGDGAD